MRRLLLALSVLALLAVPSAASAEGEPSFESIEVPPIEVRAKDGGGELHHVVEDPLPFQRSTVTSLAVTYKGSWPADAKNAFAYAMAIWEVHLDAVVPIAIEANWKPLGAQTLGNAGPGEMNVKFPNAPSEAYYPAALANQYAGYDFNPKKPDIVSNFNSSWKKWYFGTDGRPSSGQQDFVSVVLHEIGHGLGFSGTAQVSPSIGSLGVPTKYVVGAIFDSYLLNKDGKPLLGGFKPRSAELRAQMISGTLFWGGARAGLATPGTAPRLYAPKTWDTGSSVYHLDEDLYPAGTPDTLMTPMQADGEASHSPGPIIRGIMADIGWPMAPMDPAHLYFLENPGAVNPDELMHIQPRVAVLNARGNTLTSDESTVVTIYLTGNDKADLTCDGGLAKKVKAGVAAFGGCRIQGGGPNLRIVATTEGIAPIESPPFLVMRRGGFRGTLPGVSLDR